MTEVRTLQPDARAVRLRVRRPRAAADRRARHGGGAVHRGLLHRQRPRRRRPAERGLHLPVPQPGDRPGRGRGRRGRRHPGGALRGDRAGPRLGGLQHLPALRGADRDAHHRDAAPGARGAGVGLRPRRRGRGLPLPRPPHGPHRRAADGPDARHGRGRAGRRRGDHVAHARRAWRQHGHPGDARRRDGVLPGQRARRRCSSLGDGHARQGEGEVCGTGGRGGDEHRRGRRPGQGRRRRRRRGWRATTS